MHALHVEGTHAFVGELHLRDNVVEALIVCGALPAAKGKVYNLSDFHTMEQFVSGGEERLA